MLIIVVYYCLEEHWYLGIANYEIYSEDKSITCRIQGKDTLIYLINQAPGPYWENLDSTDRAQRGPYLLTESQIFYRPARPYSVNKHFIIWPLTVENFENSVLG